MMAFRLALAGILATTVAAGSAPTRTDDTTAVVRVTQSGGFTEETRVAIAEAAWMAGAETTVLDRVTLRLLSVSRGPTVVQSAADGYGYPMLTTAADPGATVHGVAVRQALAAGQMVMSETAASIRGALPGDVVRLEGLNGSATDVVIGAIVPDIELGWSEIWISHLLATSLGIDRPQAVLLWGASPSWIAALVRLRVDDDSVRISDGSRVPMASDPVLPVVAVKERFGEFALRPGAGDAVIVDPEWRDRWIVSVDLPLVGATRCHRMVVPYVRGALAEIEAAGLADLLSRDDFQLAGGCYVPRFNRGGDPGFSLSRHTWGIAIDFNPSTNRYGDEPTLPATVVDIFGRWGFSWGGAWTVPDGMHFEWLRLPETYSVSCSTMNLVPVNGAPAGGWSLLPRTAGCP